MIERAVPVFRLILLILLFANASVGHVYAQGSREYDPRSMTRTEVQMIQDAMIWVSSYGGLKDGGWGRMAIEASRNWRRENGLRQSEAFTETELELLFRQSMAARAKVGWKMASEPFTGIWLGYPSAFVQPGEPRSPSSGVRAVDFRGRDDAVVLTALKNEMGLADMRSFLNGFASMDGVARINYRLDRDFRQVVSGDMKTGSTFYVRFDRSGADWRGFYLLVRPPQIDVGRMITAVSAEFSATGSSVIESPYDGPLLGPILARIVEPDRPSPQSRIPAPIASVPSPTPPPPPLRTAPVVEPVSLPPKREEFSGSGTAFVVRKDGTFLTNQHVIDQCTRLTLADGTSLDVVAADKRRDLALLRAPNLATPELVRFRRDATIDLGEGVSLFGFPLYRAISTGMNLTNGIVTSLSGLGDDPMNFQINAAMQPGNSGGPLLDDAGLLIGIAVARLNDRVVMREMGVVPQTMNYAIRGAIAESFLLENGILAEKVASQGKTDLREVARSMQAAVRPVLCYR